jgi:hypothetical protein|nr:MAG TPA: hypothetical protein [Bacteriophage sp.]
MFTRVNKISQRKCPNVWTKQILKMSNRLDKTNPENVQTIAQIGMIKRKCLLEFTFCSNVSVVA